MIMSFLPVNMMMQNGETCVFGRATKFYCWQMPPPILNSFPLTSTPPPDQTDLVLLREEFKDRVKVADWRPFLDFQSVFPHQKNVQPGSRKSRSYSYRQGQQPDPQRWCSTQLRSNRRTKGHDRGQHSHRPYLRYKHGVYYLCSVCNGHELRRDDRGQS